MMRRTMVVLMTLALLAAACGDGSEQAEVAEADASQAVADVPEPEAPRAVGSIGVRATTAPEWQANGTVRVAADERGILSFGQVLRTTGAFELRSIELETQGAFVGEGGTDGPFDVGGELTLRLVPDGPLPDAFDGSVLPVLGQVPVRGRIEAFDGYGPGTFPRITLDVPMEVPAARVLVGLRLWPADSVKADAVVLVGRRGIVGGTGPCEDHNPQGMYLEFGRPGGTATLPVSAVPPAPDDECGEGTPAAFNLTMRLSGPVLTDEVAAELAAALPAAPQLVALGSGPSTDPGGTPGTAAPAPAPAPSPTPTPAPEPAPSGATVKARTFAPDHRNEPLGLAGYWWGPSAYAEVAQSLRVAAPFELTEIRFGVHRVSAIENWRTVPEEKIAWDHDVVWEGTIPDTHFRVTIWPLDGPGAETLDMAGVAPITEQMLVADVPIANYTGRQSARLQLGTPVRLEAGHYLVSLGIDRFGDPNAFNLYVIGRSHGYTDQTGFFRDKGTVVCDYPAPTTDYTDGRAYYRVFSIVARPTLLENATTVFREHRAKVLSESLNECRTRGNPDYFLPGDIELTLLGD